jgi:Xaa-Pro dipeptidase
MLNPKSLPDVQRAIADAGVDGWLLYDFRGLNPILPGLLGIEGMATRRVFVLIPREGQPVAITHAIEQGPWAKWPRDWGNRIYSGWRVLETELGMLVKGKRVAMEYSAGDAVPYLDRVPAGVLELVRNVGATVVSSADLVTQFYAVLTEPQIESHKRAAETISHIAHEAMRIAGERASSNNPATEYELHRWILDRFTEKDLFVDHGPIVAIGPNAANPHYEPAPEQSPKIQRGDILLIDLWATEKGGVNADQTWMGSLGGPRERDGRIWDAVRDARDAAIKLLEDGVAARRLIRGAEVDDAARNVISSRGYGEYFFHRTGHSIDARDLHGSGPHMDNLETREERTLMPGVAFSIEPGVYLAGDVGMRSEVNGLMGDGSITITPKDIQRELIIV